MPCSAKLLLFAITLLASFPLVSQDQGKTAPLLTVEQITRNPTGTPPQRPVWSPDGNLLTFIATAPLDGLPAAKNGDIVQVEASTGKMSVLVSAANIDALGANTVNEKDRDHRERYGMADYQWSADAHHLLLDKGGKLWLWDIPASNASLVVDTKAGSGDDPKFSPDGKMVSYLRDHNLYVHPVGDSVGTETPLTTTPAGSEPDSLLNGEVDWVYLEELEVRTNYAWSPDSKAIAYLQMDETKVPRSPIEDYIPTHATVDWQRYPQPGDPNPAVRVGVVPVTGGSTTWITVPFSPNNDYIPRFGWIDANTLYVEVVTRDHTHRNIYLADARTGASHLLHTETDPKYLKDDYDISFLPHGRFILPSWRDGHTHLYLYRFSPEHPLSTDASLLRQLTHGNYDVLSLAVPERNGQVDSIFFTSTEGSPLEIHLWTIDTDGSGKRQLTRSKGTHHTMVSPQGQYFTDLVSTLETPPTVSLCQTAAPQTCNSIWQSRPAPEAPGIRSSIVTLKAADGVTTLYGLLTQPTGAAQPHSVPIILNPYGGPTPAPGVGNRWPNLFDKLMAQHGFAILQVDNRGSGGRGRDFEQAAYRNFGAVQFADQIAALDQVLATDTTLDPNRVGWWGWSWGGFFTLYAMTHTDRIKAGVAVAPGNTDFRNYDSIYTERYMGLPAQNEQAYKASDLNSVASQLKGHILIVHGTGDDNVHMNNTMQFIQGLITAGIPYDLQLFPRLTHSLAGPVARNELFTRILYHFETYLKPQASTP